MMRSPYCPELTIFAVLFWHKSEMNGRQINEYYQMMHLSKLSIFVCALLAIPALLAAKIPSPNDFTGSDTERIQAAINAAKGTSGKVIIPADNSNGTHLWKIDHALLLPSDLTVILDNCTLRLSDESRDNMFRSDNVGEGITQPTWNRNIHLVGVGQVRLQGALNPRSTGDSGRQLTLDTDAAKKAGNWRVSYGSDAGKADQKQTGDWRNILILMAYVDGFTLTNVSIENTHGWSVSFERTLHAEITQIRIDNREELDINGKTVSVANKDGINLRQGCKYFRIDNISGYTGDDFIALSNLGSGPEDPRPNGALTSTMVTASTWFGPEDDIEHVHISNIHSANRYRAVAIRATDQAGIHHVFINSLQFQAAEGKYEAILLGGGGYGKPSLPGKIHHIYAMNLNGTGKCLVRIESPVHDCGIINAVYEGEADDPILYTTDKDQVQRLELRNVIHSSSSIH